MEKDNIDRKTTFMITARLKSSRLPKKIMLKVQGKPIIVHMLDRIKRAKNINNITICTSTNSQDDPLENLAEEQGVSCFRGSEMDVLQRLLDAANMENLDYFANITADCPLIDPEIIDRAIRIYNIKNSDLTYYSTGNNDVPFNCYIIKVDALRKVCKLKNQIDTECWFRFFSSLDDITINEIDVEKTLRHPRLKTSLDYQEDYEFIKRIFDNLYNVNNIFTMKDIVNHVKKNSSILSINANDDLLKRWRRHQKETQRWNDA